MSSKSIPERSAPHQGMGRASKCFSAFCRYFRIHSGSDFRAEISLTTAADRPALRREDGMVGSFQSKR